ncbi:MAG: hypothetical protein ABIQ18_15285 [Umezawaea sp.]
MSSTAILDALADCPITDQTAREHPDPLIRAQADTVGVPVETARARWRTRAVLVCHGLRINTLGPERGAAIDEWVQRQLDTPAAAGTTVPAA